MILIDCNYTWVPIWYKLFIICWNIMRLTLFIKFKFLKNVYFVPIHKINSVTIFKFLREIYLVNITKITYGFKNSCWRCALLMYGHSRHFILHSHPSKLTVSSNNFINICINISVWYYIFPILQDLCKLKKVKIFTEASNNSLLFRKRDKPISNSFLWYNTQQMVHINIAFKSLVIFHYFGFRIQAIQKTFYL